LLHAIYNIHSVTTGGIVGGTTLMQSITSSAKNWNSDILRPVSELIHRQLFGRGSTHCFEQSLLTPSDTLQHTRPSTFIRRERQSVPKLSGIEPA
jgi:hypothetical protein